MKKTLIIVLGMAFFSGLPTASYTDCEGDLTACQKAHERTSQRQTLGICQACHSACLQAMTSCHSSTDTERQKQDAIKLKDECSSWCRR
jgi:hypothetical protein